MTGDGGDDGISAVGWDEAADFGVGVWSFAAGGCVSQDGAGGAECGRAFCGGPGDQLLRCVAVLRADAGGGGGAGRGDGGGASWVSCPDGWPGRPVSGTRSIVSSTIGLQLEAPGGWADGEGTGVSKDREGGAAISEGAG